MSSILFSELFWMATVVEIMLVLAALPGLVLWLLNMKIAIRAKRAVDTFRVMDGRQIISKHQIRSTASWAGIHLLFVLIGLLLWSYTRPGEVTIVREIIYALAITALLWLSYLAWDWRQMHYRLFGLAGKK